MTAPTISPLSDPPNINQPGDFPAEASTFLGGFPTLQQEVNAVVQYFNQGDFGQGAARLIGVATGTANDITITTGLNKTALEEGQTIVFKAANTNDAATVINPDSVGYKNAVDTAGQPLYAGYIVTDYWYTLYDDGTNYVVQMAEDLPGGTVKLPDINLTSPSNFWILDEDIKGDNSVTLDEVLGNARRIGNLVTLELRLALGGFSRAFNDDGGIFFRFDAESFGQSLGLFNSIKTTNFTASLFVPGGASGADYPPLPMATRAELAGTIVFSNSDSTYVIHDNLATTALVYVNISFEVGV